MPTTDEDRRRWRPRPVPAAAVRAAAVLVPLVASVAAGLLVGRLVPDVDGLPGVLLWWTAVIAAAVGTLLVVDRLARRLLPLAALLRLSMLFPDEAPSRLRVARRGLGTRALADEVAQHRHEHDDHGDLPRAALTDAQRRGLSGSRQEAAETILGLVTALTDHDRRTRGHSERVHLYVSVLAEEMGLPPDDRDRLVWAALVHDVGKLVVPLEILNKPAKPTADEWEVLEAHPAAGAALCEPLRAWLGPWFGAVGEHHEKYDGSGYPGGLAGEGISLGARIVAVADAFEVMTADRPYSRATSPAAARQELVRCAGSHFDPAVVRAFLGVPVRRLRLLPAPLAVLAQLPFAPRPTASSTAAFGASAAAVAVVTAALVTGVAPSTAAPAPDVASGAPGVVADGGAGDGGGADAPPAPGDAVVPSTAPADPAPPADDLGTAGGGGGGTGPDAPAGRPATSGGTPDGALRTAAPPPAAPAPAPTAPAPAPPAPEPPAPAPPVTSPPTSAPTTPPSAPEQPPAPGGPTGETVEASTLEDTPTRVRVLDGPRSGGGGGNDDGEGDDGEDDDGEDEGREGGDDEDGDGGPVQLVGVGEPSLGTARTEGNAVRYTPDPDVSGTDVFPFYLEDRDGRRTEGLIRMTVVPVEDPPRPVDDEAVTDTAEPVVLTPARNDTDPDGDPVRLAEVGQPSHGTTELLPGGRVRYTPDDGYTGDDAFSYVVDDGTSTAVGEARLLVTEPPRAGTLWLRGRGNDVRRASGADPARDLSRDPPVADRTDWDADGRPGLTLAEDVVETWDFPVRDGRLVLDGPVRMLVRSRLPESPAPQGWSARLEDCAPDGRCLAITEAGDPFVDPWTTSDTWDARVLDLGEARAVVPEGHVLRLGFAFSVSDGYLALDRRDPTTLGLTVRPLAGGTSLEGATDEVEESAELLVGEELGGGDLLPVPDPVEALVAVLDDALLADGPREGPRDDGSPPGDPVDAPEQEDGTPGDGTHSDDGAPEDAAAAEGGPTAAETGEGVREPDVPEATPSEPSGG